MFTVIIIDDEPKVRNGLHKLITEHDKDWDVIGLYSDGDDALQNINKFEKLDLIITDVKMPKMDGLEFIRSIRFNFPNVAIIIISGFNEFEFAQKAIKYNVVSYLLKPLNIDEFYSVVNKIKDQLQYNLHKDVNTLNEYDMQVYKDNLFKDALKQVSKNVSSSEDKILTNKTDSLMILQQNSIKITRPFQIAIVKCLLHNQEINRIFPLIQNIISNYPDTTVYRLLPSFCVIIVYTSYPEICEKLLAELLSKIEESIAIGYSNVFENYEYLYIAYQQAYQAVNLSIYYPAEKRIYMYSLHSFNLKDFIKTQEERMFNSIKSGNANSALIFVNSIYKCFSDNKVYINIIEEWIHQLVEKCDEIIKSYNIDTKLFSEKLLVIKSISLVYYYSDMQNDILSLIKQISEEIKIVLDKKSNQKINEILDYIESRYNKDITLDEIANYAGLNRTYTSHLFKKKTNVNLIDYITRVRLEKAKDYLKNSEIKIHEIAENIGFVDFKYFNKIFKRNTGVTPSEFRKFSRDV